MSDKTTFTNPKAPGASQETTFIQVEYADGQGERERSKVKKTSASRGEKKFATLPTAR